MGQREQQDIDRAMRAQRINDGIHPLVLCRQPLLQLFQEVHPVHNRAAAVAARERLATGGLEATKYVAFAAPTIVYLLFGTWHGFLRELLHWHGARKALCRFWSH